MTSSDISQLVYQSISPSMVTDRLVRLMWARDYGAAAHVACEMSLTIRRLESMLGRGVARLTLSQTEIESIKMSLEGARTRYHQAKADMSATRPLVYHHHA